MMRTLPLYISRHYLAAFLLILLGILGVIFVFDVIELLRRSAWKDTSFGIILIMGLLHLPDIVQKILPFIALFAAMLTLWRLTRSQELIVVRASGVSVWQFLTPMLITTLLLGLFYLFAINPLGTLMKSAYRELENKYIENSTITDLSSAGLWLRQKEGDTNVLLHADSVSLNPFTIKPVIAFMYDAKNNYLGRLDADSAVLQNKQWLIAPGWRNWKDKPPEKTGPTTIPTTLSLAKIQESMSAPGVVSFWEFPHFISALEATGFPGTRHRMMFHGLIAQPLFLCAMVIAAACFSLGMARRGDAFFWALAGLFVGSFAFGFNDVIQALGTNQAIPTWLAAFAVPVITASAGMAVLFHLEDG
ncbi:MAG TPA: LptF/LptG family permease [Alphaproteobacteria bacterium]|nr:LptF/LptG family permease [Alphaproteobacteria bacterium]